MVAGRRGGGAGQLGHAAVDGWIITRLDEF